MSLGSRLRKAREEKKWSTRRLEMETERLGRKVSHGFISQIENPRYDANPSLATIDVLSRALGMTPAALLSGNEEGVNADTTSIDENHPVLARIKSLATSKGLSYTDILTQAETTEADIALIDPDDPDPHKVWPLAAALGTSMAYLSGETDDPRPILEPGQAAHNRNALWDPGADLIPEDIQDLERAYLEIERRRAERRRKQGKR